MVGIYQDYPKECIDSEKMHWLIKELIHVANLSFLQCGTDYKSIRYDEIKTLGLSIDEEPFFLP